MILNPDHIRELVKTRLTNELDRTELFLAFLDYEFDNSFNPRKLFKLKSFDKIMYMNEVYDCKGNHYLIDDKICIVSDDLPDIYAIHLKTVY